MLVSPWQKPFRGMQLNKAHPLSRGLVGTWIFNEATGDKVFDLSGNSNHGINNGADWVPDGLDFVASNSDYLNITENGNSLQLGTAFTLHIWIKTTSTVGDIGVIEKAAALSNWNPSILLRVNRTTVNKFGAYIRDTDGTTVNIQSTSDVNDGQLHLCSVVRDGVIVKIYIDGIYETFGGNAGLGVTDVNSIWFFGKTYNSTPVFFDGSIYSTLFYNRALSPSEIAWLHREPYAMFQQPISPASLYYEAVSGVVTGAELMAMLI